MYEQEFGKKAERLYDLAKIAERIYQNMKNLNSLSDLQVMVQSRKYYREEDDPDYRPVRLIEFTYDNGIYEMDVPCSSVPDSLGRLYGRDHPLTIKFTQIMNYIAALEKIRGDDWQYAQRKLVGILDKLDKRQLSQPAYEAFINSSPEQFLDEIILENAGV